ncbi:unnamed protein product [Amoebophrya sp. A25]|nr:unnamed protein product [Amoebophrya sp. A25]|eukprot:GSA25T00010287001.1
MMQHFHHALSSDMIVSGVPTPSSSSYRAAPEDIIFSRPGRTLKTMFHRIFGLDGTHASTGKSTNTRRGHTAFVLADSPDLIASAAQSAREAAIAAESAAQAAKVAIAEVAVARQASGNARKQIHYLRSAMDGPQSPTMGSFN